MSQMKHPNGQWEDIATYDNVEFALATASTDYNVKTQQVTSFLNVPHAKYVSLRTDQTVTIKLNSASNGAITVTSSDSPFKLVHDEVGLMVDNVFITNNSGSNANIKLFLS